MLEKLGKRRFAAPFLMMIVFGLMFSLMLYPIANMQVKNLPFGILSLDEGAVTPMGEANAGDAMLETLTSATHDNGSEDAAENDESVSDTPIAWIAFDSQEELDTAFENAQIYGALVIPADFTAAQVAMAAGLSETTTAIDIYVDMAKNPMAANLIQSLLTTMVDQLGLDAKITVMNEGPNASGANPFASAMSQNFLIMPLVMLSIMLSLVSSLLFAPKASTSHKKRFASLAKQVVYLAVLSCGVGAVSVFSGWIALGIEESLGAIFGFAWIASFCVMMLVLGCANLALPLGALVALCIMIGMGCGMLAPEMLPDFWRDWIYPWAPQHFVGDGLRSIMYLGEGALNSSVAPLAITACVGAIALLISPFAPAAHKSEADNLNPIGDHE